MQADRILWTWNNPIKKFGIWRDDHVPNFLLDDFEVGNDHFFKEKRKIPHSSSLLSPEEEGFRHRRSAAYF